MDSQATRWGVSGNGVGTFDAANSPILSAHSDPQDMRAAVIGDTNDDGFTHLVVRATVDTHQRMAVFTGPMLGALDLSTAAVGPLLSSAGDLDADGLDDYLFQYSYDTEDGVRFGYQLSPSASTEWWSIRAAAITREEAVSAVANHVDADGYGDFTTRRTVGACDLLHRGTGSIGYGAKPANPYVFGLAGRTVRGIAFLKRHIPNRYTQWSDAVPRIREPTPSQQHHLNTQVQKLCRRRGHDTDDLNLALTG
ncbi:MAG: hypothetical protein ACJATT_004356 [Myxococcota bacterium]